MPVVQLPIVKVSAPFLDARFPLTWNLALPEPRCASAGTTKVHVLEILSFFETSIVIEFDSALSAISREALGIGTVIEAWKFTLPLLSFDTSFPLAVARSTRGLEGLSLTTKENGLSGTLGPRGPREFA